MLFKIILECRVDLRHLQDDALQTTSHWARRDRPPLHGCILIGNVLAELFFLTFIISSIKNIAAIHRKQICPFLLAFGEVATRLPETSFVTLSSPDETDIIKHAKMKCGCDKIDYNYVKTVRQITVIRECVNIQVLAKQRK